MKKLLLMIFFAISVSAFAVDGYLRVGAITETNSYNHESGSLKIMHQLLVLKRLRTFFLLI